jgi:hypothetical protein
VDSNVRGDGADETDGLAEVTTSVESAPDVADGPALGGASVEHAASATAIVGIPSVRTQVRYGLRTFRNGYP